MITVLPNFTEAGEAEADTEGAMEVMDSNLPVQR